MNSTLTTAMPALQRDVWHARTLATFCDMEIDYPSGATFTGALLNTSLNRLQLATIASSPVDVRRKREHIGRQQQAHYLLKFQLGGTGVIEQCGKVARLRPGDFVLCTTAEPYRLRFAEHYQQAVLAIPQPLMQELYGHADDMLGVRMGYESATNSLLSQFVGSVLQRLNELDQATLARLEGNLLDLLTTSLQSAMANPQAALNSHTSVHHLSSAKRIIALNLDNPRLNADLIAQIEGISKRYLHMLFKSEAMSLSKYIQHQRLEACRRALRHPDYCQRSTTDIALQWGFSDVSHFHRCFKARYGVTPRQYKLSESP